MGIFEKVGETISSTGKDVANKAKSVADFARLRHKIFMDEEKLRDLYCELGEKYFDDHSDSADEAYGFLFREIEKAQQNLDAAKEQLNVIRGVKICESCGAEADEDFEYCGRCGAKLPERVVEAEVAETCEEACEAEDIAEESDEEKMDF